MRTEKEMFDLILDFAKNDERIKIVSMNGSRVNANITKDSFQDYDIVFIVTDMKSFINEDNWLKHFGKQMIMQKPEAMELFPPSLGNWFSYLIYFEDETRIDLILVPLEELDLYLSDDKLTEILLDKDNLIKYDIIPTDVDYHVKAPNPSTFSDCCNEFWWVSTYVVKGLCRGEILFAIKHFEILKTELLRMIEWDIGFQKNFSLSIGKCSKFLDKYISKADFETLLSSYNYSDFKNCWESLFISQKLFRKYSKLVCKSLNTSYPDFDEKISAFTKRHYDKMINNL